MVSHYEKTSSNMDSPPSLGRLLFLIPSYLWFSDGAAGHCALAMAHGWQCKSIQAQHHGGLDSACTNLASALGSAMDLPQAVTVIPSQVSPQQG